MFALGIFRLGNRLCRFWQIFNYKAEEFYKKSRPKKSGRMKKEKGKTESQKKEKGKTEKQKTENRKQKTERINVRSEYRNAVGIVKIGDVLGLQNVDISVIIGAENTESYGEDRLWGSLR